MKKILKILKWLIIIILSILILVTGYYSITELFLKEDLNEDQEIYISTHFYNNEIQFSVSDFSVGRSWYIGPTSRSQFNIFRYPGMAFHKKKDYYLCFQNFDTAIPLPERRSLNWFTDTGYINRFYGFQSNIEDILIEDQKKEQILFLKFLRANYDPLDEYSLDFIKTAQLSKNPYCLISKADTTLPAYNVKIFDDYGIELRRKNKYAQEYPISEQFNEMLSNEITYEEFQKKLEDFLATGKDIDTKNEQGHTLLYSATRRSLDFEEELMKRISFLLEKGADPNAVFNQNTGGILNGYQPNSVDMIKILVEHGVDVNMKNNRNENPLWSVKSSESARILIESGADVCAKNFQGKTLKDSADYYIQNPHIGSWCNKIGGISICEFFVSTYDEKCDNVIIE